MFVIPKTNNQSFTLAANLANGVNKIGNEKISIYTANQPRLTVDGSGNVGIGTTNPDSNYKLHIIGDLRIEGSILPSGNVYNIDATTLTVDDPMIRLADNNPDDTQDIGFYGMYVDTGVTKFRGLIHDASLNQWNLFTDELTEPTETEFTYANNPIISAHENGVSLGISGQLVNDIGAIRLHIHKNETGGCNLQFTNNDTGVESDRGFRIGLTSTEEAQIWEYENKAMRFATNNAERMRISAEGNIGIGTQNTGEFLNLRRSGTHTYINIDTENNTSYDSGIRFKQNNIDSWVIYSDHGDGNFYFNENTNDTRMILQTGGYVGIGTNNPSQLLTLNASSNPFIHFNVSGVNKAAIGHNAVQDGLYIYSTTDTAFYTNGANERMRITTTGDVGIGITNPTAKLQVDGDVYVGTTENDTILHILADTTTGNGGRLRLHSNFAATATTWDIFSGSGGGSPTNDLRFYLNNSTEIMRLKTGGNVGIGTSNPTQKLEVNGNIQMGTSGNFFYGPSNASLTIQALANGATEGLFLSSTVANDSKITLSQAEYISFDTANTEKMRIISNGNVGIGTTVPARTLDVKGDITSKNSCIIRRKTAAQSISNVTDTAVTFTQSDTAFGSDITATSSSLYTINNAGLYQVDYVLSFAANTSGKRSTWISLTSVNVRYGSQENSGVADALWRASGSALINCAASDTIQIYVWQNSGGDLNVEGGSANANTGRLTIYRIGDAY